MSSTPERVTILELEGLALNGFVVNARLAPCEGPLKGFKIVADLTDGRSVETECSEHERVSRTFILVTRYRGWGSKLVKREFSGRVMRGITYDLTHKFDEG